MLFSRSSNREDDYIGVLTDDPDSEMLYDDGDNGWLSSVRHVVFDIYPVLRIVALSCSCCYVSING